MFWELEISCYYFDLIFELEVYRRFLPDQSQPSAYDDWPQAANPTLGGVIPHEEKLGGGKPNDCPGRPKN